MNMHDFLHGKSFDAYKYFGAIIKSDSVTFRTYAPQARGVAVIGDFNDWKPQAMTMSEPNGVYSIKCDNAKVGDKYKFRIYHNNGEFLDHTDPYGLQTELRPDWASVITDLSVFEFDDEKWMNQRTKNYNRPMNIYEIHLGSWRTNEDDENGWYSYEEISDQLVEYVKANNFTHIEVLPLSEYPADCSWGYQVTGFFSATSRYGDPVGLKKLINKCHENDIGVITDFVPIHFAVNDYALFKYDGKPLYEYPDDDIGYSQWGSLNFNYYRGEVCSFLQSAANFWLEEFHFDGIRMDAISNALYWQGNSDRGVNEGAVTFVQNMNEGLHKLHPTAILVAEDSTSFLKVTAPVEYDGLGFDYKWDMGWMNDTLSFFETDFIFRNGCKNYITFSMHYFYSELFLLPFSHDEVVHGKKTIVDKCFGTYEQKFAQCRTIYAYMFTHPGKKLNFMGNELGVFREWDETRELDWDMLKYPMHDSFRVYFNELSKLYIEDKSLHDGEYDERNFAWIDCSDHHNSVFAYVRGYGDEKVLVVINGNNIQYESLMVFFDEQYQIKELINSDELRFSGTGICNPEVEMKYNKLNKQYSANLKIAPLASAIFKINLVEEAIDLE